MDDDVDELLNETSTSSLTALSSKASLSKTLVLNHNKWNRYCKLSKVIVF